jgi:hypothetical protein
MYSKQAGKQCLDCSTSYARNPLNAMVLAGPGSDLQLLKAIQVAVCPQARYELSDLLNGINFGMTEDIRHRIVQHTKTAGQKKQGSILQILAQVYC